MMLSLVLALLALRSCHGVPHTVTIAKGSTDEHLFITELVNELSWQFGNLTEQEKTLNPELTACEKKVNTTIDACSACSKEKCKQPGPPQNFFSVQTLYTIGNGLKTFGASAPHIASKYGVLAGRAIAKGASEAIGAISSLFDSSTGQKLKEFGNKLLDFGNKIGDLIGASLAKITSFLEDWGKQIANSFTKLFGRRKRSTTTKELTDEQKACFKGACNAECGVFLDKSTMQAKICGGDLKGKADKMLAALKIAQTMFKELNTTSAVVLQSFTFDTATAIIGQYVAMIQTKVATYTPATTIKMPPFAFGAALTELYKKISLDYYAKYAVAAAAAASG